MEIVGRRSDAGHGIGCKWGREIGKDDALEIHERELLDQYRRLEHQQAMVRVENERHKAQDRECTKDITDAKAETAKAK